MAKRLKNSSSSKGRKKRQPAGEIKNVGGDEAMCGGRGGRGGDLGEFGGGDLGAEILGLRPGSHGPTLGH